MLISCSSCNSQFLVNSADLKPDGRKVQCAKCGYNWFQTITIEDTQPFISPVSSTKKEKDQNNKAVNLPSTYVKEPKVSMINTILVIIFMFISFTILWLLKSNGINFFVLINFYIHEFYFNLKLIINDLTNIILQIIN